MADYLHALGLDFITEDEDTIRNFLGHVLSNGKAIHNYYGLPYINEHFGSTQIICRVGHNPEGDGLQFTGFDSHADSLCVWKMRIEHKMNNADEEDPTRVKLLAKGLDGSSMLAIDVANGDILPSFKKDEIIELQMVAFAEKTDFFADEEAYADTVEPGPNGKKTMIGENTIFPIGFFSESEEVKDVVQIHGTIKRMTFGTSQFDDQKIQSNIRCHVDTQLGEIVVILPFDDIEDVKNNENMREGKIIDCYARLSGDAAIYAYEKGIVKDAENNLKLVAYTLEDGDPERLRSVLAKDFVYHSENAGKHIEDVDEYIDFVKAVHGGGEIAHTYYATIASIDDGPNELEYTVGTRCAVISYESEEGYNSIIFVDTNESGEVKRIYLSKESRYHFKVDDPFPEKEDLAEMLARTTYKSSIIGRSHFHGLIDEDLDEEAIDLFISEHKNELEADLTDIFRQEISEEAFADAFLRGVCKSKITDYKDEDIKSIGRQFHKDATLFKSEEEQKNTFHDALVLVTTIGRHYKGRVDAQ